MTLTEALAATYNNNPTLLAQRARLRETDEGVPQALSGWRPTVQFTGSAGVQRNEATDLQQRTLTPRTLDLNVTQPIYKQVLRRQLEATQDRFRVGEVTRTDVSQAEATLATATATRVQSEGTLQNVRANFERFIGEPPGLLEPPSERPILPTSRAEAATLAGNNNPNVISAQFNEAAARDAVRVVRGQLLPQLSIIGDIGKSQETQTQLQNRTSNTASVIARMTVPLYEAGQIYSQTRQANETVGERRNQIDDTRRQAVQTAQSDFETLQANRAQVRSLLASVKANEVAYEGVQQEALVGARTVLDVLTAEQTLFTSRVGLVQAQHLNLPVQIYDFDKYYRAVRNKWIGFGSSE